jgi:hypothetical protein
VTDRRAQDSGRAVTAGICTRIYYYPVLGNCHAFSGQLCKVDGEVCGEVVQERLKAAALLSYNYQQTGAIH